MSPLLQTLIASALVGAAFPLGALAARLNRWGHTGFAAVMALGAGLLLATALVDLAPHAVQSLGLEAALGIFLAAAAAYSVVNHWLSRRGARHRKRCGGCVAPPSESEQGGSGTAIAVGTVMDAVPEALVLGTVTAMAGADMGADMGAGGAFPVALVAALLLGNLAQAMSATSGLRESGRGPRFVWGLWFGVGFGVIALALAACFAAGALGGSAPPALMALAAGVLVAMIAEAMLPEAAEGSATMIGLLTAAGAALFLLIHS